MTLSDAPDEVMTLAADLVSACGSESPPPVAVIARRARRARSRRAALIGTCVLVLGVCLWLIAPTTSSRPTRVRTADNRSQPQIVPMRDATLVCGPTGDACARGADGYSSAELQTVGVASGVVVPTGVHTYNELTMALERRTGPGCPARGCGTEHLAETDVPVSADQVRRRINALRAGRGTPTQPGPVSPPRCLGRPDASLNAFTGLFVGFAERLASENDLTFRTAGVNGHCFPSRGGPQPRRVNVDVVDGVVVGAQWG